MKAAATPILILLTACASSHKETSSISYMQSTDSVNSIHVENIMHRSDSTFSHTMISIDSISIRRDSISEHIYGVKFAQIEQKIIDKFKSQNSDSINRIHEDKYDEIKTDQTHNNPTIPTINFPLLFIIIICLILILKQN